MSNGAQNLGAAWGNPTVGSGSNATFPYDQTAATALSGGPEGLVASPLVLNEFLNPPDMRGDWFCNKVWQETSLVLQKDPSITGVEYIDLTGRVNRMQDALVRWTELRPDMTKGYADTIPADMRKAGAEAWTEARSLLSMDLVQRSDLSADSADALANCISVLWEYVHCAGLELESSHDQRPVTDIRDTYAKDIADSWEPGVTPTNVDAGGITIGAQRLPAEAPTGEPGSPDDGGDPGRLPSSDPGPEVGGDPGSLGDPGGGPEAGGEGPGHEFGR